MDENVQIRPVVGMVAMPEDNFEKAIDIGGTRLRVCCAGQGKPAVVIEAGLGDGLDDWRTVQARIAAFTRACAYDRAGVGKSSPGPKPRTSRRMVTELRALLQQARMEGPYVLVGHSLGGLNALLFAAEHPDEVAGLVLLDPSFPDMGRRLEPVLGKFWMPLWNNQFVSQAEGMTKQDFVASCIEVVDAGRLPQIPLLIISAGQPVRLPFPLNRLFPGAALVRVMQEGHAALAEKSRWGRHLIAEKCTHLTVREDARVIAAIREITLAAR